MSAHGVRVRCCSCLGRAPHKVDTIRLVFHSDQGATDLISMLSLANARCVVSASLMCAFVYAHPSQTTARQQLTCRNITMQDIAA